MRTDICDRLGIEFPIFAFSHCRDVVAAVTNAGGAIVKDIFSFPGGRRFEFTDPAGNHLAVWGNDPAQD